MRGLAARYCSSQPSPQEVEAPGAVTDFPAVLLKKPVLDEFGRAYATGRRKTSVARVWIKEGSGQFVVNDKSLLDYFQPIQREHALGAFVASKTAGLFDTFCTVKGGGISGQAGAVRLGISRALEAFDPSHRILLRQFDMLTRDSRRVERKKPGQKKARKKFQVRIFGCFFVPLLHFIFCPSSLLTPSPPPLSSPSYLRLVIVGEEIAT